ncbi:MAG: choice-of-anchor D domain-containing protein, partial [Acidobacteria bacterium]|nr:choice-of-anchor D domain-containing protein [Acidobacteriota bacterium]
MDRTTIGCPKRASHRTLAHEIGHNLGLHHPFTTTCSGKGTDSDSALPDDFVSQPGYDPWKAEFIEPARTDIMSYCNAGDGNSWLGPVNFRILVGGKLLPAGPKLFSADPAIRTAGKSGARAVEDAPRQALLVRGTVRQDGSSGTLAAVHTLPDPPDDPPPSANANHCLRLWGDAGLLTEYCFPLVFENLDQEDDQPKMFDELPFSFLLPAQSGLKRLTLVRSDAPDVELAALAAGSGAPSIQIIDPQPGALASGSLHLGWTGTDPDGRPITFLAQYSSNGGQTWISLGGDRTGNDLNFSSSGIQGGDQIHFRVIGSAGLDTGSATAGPFSLSQSPNLEVDPSGGDVEFGQALVHNTASQTVVIRNSGDGPAAIGPITIDSDLFEVVDRGEQFTLQAGEKAEIELSFTPRTEGTQAATVTIPHNTSQSPFTLGLIGLGVFTATPLIKVNPASVDFGALDAGSSRTVKLVVKNLGLLALSVDAISITGDRFQFVNPVSPFQLDPGANQMIAVKFSPNAGGAAAGSVDITSNDPANPVLKVLLAGTGIALDVPVISVDAASLDLGSVTVGQAATRTLKIANAGKAALNVSAISPAGMFSVVSPAVPFQVAAGANTLVTVRFSPTVAGTQSGTLSITSNDPASATVRIPLSGVGIAASAPKITVEPASLDFGDVTAGQTRSRTLKVSNTGNASLTVSAVSAGGMFGIVPPGVPLAVAAGGNMVITVLFSPTAA